MGVFMDFLKAFDQEWYNGLLAKIDAIDIEGILYKVMRSYMNNRQQFVVLNVISHNVKFLVLESPKVVFLGLCCL